jgi:hypothetical protein
MIRVWYGAVSDRALRHSEKHFLSGDEMMKSRWLLIVLFTLMVSHTSEAHIDQSSSFPAQNDNQLDRSWTLNTECGVPFWIALNVVPRDYPPAYRFILIYLEPQNCTEENCKKIFTCLPEKYTERAGLIIAIRSTKASVLNWMEQRLDFHAIRPDGTFVRRKRIVLEWYEDLKNEKWADYSRSEAREDFNFAKSANYLEWVSVEIKKCFKVSSTGNIILEPTGDLTKDLVLATRLGQEDEVKSLIDKGADVNGRTRFGSSPLLAAIDFRNIIIVNLLLDRGANINQQDVDGWTPLMYSLGMYDQTEIAEELVRRGADVNLKAENGDTALIRAVSSQQGLTKMIELLLLKGADPNVRDRLGRTPLMIAEQGDHTDYVQDLLKKAMQQK